jgi:hypothetical protein
MGLQKRGTRAASPDRERDNNGECDDGGEMPGRPGSGR